MKPRVLFVARTRYALPLNETLQRRFDALSEVMEWHQLGTAADGGGASDERFTLVPPFPVRSLDGAAFYGALPLRVARTIRSFRPDAVIVQGTQDTSLALAGRALARVDVPIVLDVHGDWRGDTRVFGSPARRLLSPAVDRVADYAVHHADGVRTVSGFTSSLVRDRGVEPTATFPAYMDLAPFLATAPAPLPSLPRALFVGVLERYKAVDILAEAWRGSARAASARACRSWAPGRWSASWRGSWPRRSCRCGWTRGSRRPDVAPRSTRRRCSCCPRAARAWAGCVVEAFCRGRAVVGTDAGGIPDLVDA